VVEFKPGWADCPCCGIGTMRTEVARGFENNINLGEAVREALAYGGMPATSADLQLAALHMRAEDYVSVAVILEAIAAALGKEGDDDTGRDIRGNRGVDEGDMRLSAR